MLLVHRQPETRYPRPVMSPAVPGSHLLTQNEESERAGMWRNNLSSQLGFCAARSGVSVSGLVYVGFLLQQTRVEAFSIWDKVGALGQAMPWTLLRRRLSTPGQLSVPCLVLHHPWCSGARLPAVPLTKLALGEEAEPDHGEP